MSLFGRPEPTMITPSEALLGRNDYSYELAQTHEILGTSLAESETEPWLDGLDVIYFGMGCFWGAEKKFWQLDGVYATAVGYQGGFTPYPTYEEVCTGRTGHAEVVVVAYDPQIISTYNVVKVFWENHDSTTPYRQGNDIGTQYRSAAFWTTTEQRDLLVETKELYAQALEGAMATITSGVGRRTASVITALAKIEPICTEIAAASEHKFYYAEPSHQQYLAKNPHGYDCHASTGVELPDN